MSSLLAVGRTKEKGCKELTKIRYSVTSDNNYVRFGFRRIIYFPISQALGKLKASWADFLPNCHFFGCLFLLCLWLHIFLII